MAKRYFLSFTSTFESLLQGKITPDDLTTGIMVFGCKREHVLLPYDRVPIELTLNNIQKPKHREQASTVGRDQVDSPVLKMWDVFASKIRKASTEGRLIFMNEIGHPSYKHFAEDALFKGDEVFWKGEWMKHIPRPVPVIEEEPDIPLPDEAFIDEILGEAGTGSVAQGFPADDKQTARPPQDRPLPTPQPQSALRR